MNFFQRRKILRNTSFLELTPVRLHEHEIEEGGLVVLLVPKFSNASLRKFLIPGNKSSHFRIKLDELGSQTWLTIDGMKNVGGLCAILVEKLGDKIQPHDEVEQRMMKFFSGLYHQRYITFREIQDY
jgi:hypothetical protein